MTEDLGAPISYLVLAEGTAVRTSDGEQLGTVKRVLAVPEDDIFDGLILDTPEGDRFVDAEHVAALYELACVLDIPSDHAHHLPEPTASAAAMEVSADDTAERGGAGHELGQALRRAWDKISGNY